MGRYESRRWEADTYESRAAQDGDPPGQIFHSYVPHPIMSWYPALPPRVDRLVNDAESGLLELNAAGGQMVDASWLLRRAESAASSTIEGVHPSARRLARAEAQLSLFGVKPPERDQEALRNIFATEKALEIADSDSPITLDTIRDIHAVLMEGEAIAGNIRHRQNWIGAGALDATPLHAAFVPPSPDHLPRLMDDLVACINQTSLNPIVHAAIVHAQFETIHPFADGNGRTGRAVIQLMLRRSGLTDRCTPPISSALALNKDEYILSLNNTHVECEPHDPARSEAVSIWVAGFSNSAIAATDFARRIATHVTDLTAGWRDAAARNGIRSGSAAARLIDLLPTQPVVTESSVAKSLGVGDRTARRAIRALVKSGVLVSRSAGKKHRAYEADALLDAYARIAKIDAGAYRLPTLEPPAFSIPDGPKPALSSAKAASRCGEWMPRAKRYCSRRDNHSGSCR